ncbi:unnamed protein product [Miscanthus lutarioriparius]|uniref:Uncharacterized protein n=1 Tax=Miscanthus lutarioriparius TaxID=422564 RepID=A0A811PYD1_9POAL|nr:unnamed protein product [Miscanthus lutarioriparius]
MATPVRCQNGAAAGAPSFPMPGHGRGAPAPYAGQAARRPGAAADTPAGAASDAARRIEAGASRPWPWHPHGAGAGLPLHLPSMGGATANLVRYRAGTAGSNGCEILRRLIVVKGGKRTRQDCAQRRDSVTFSGYILRPWVLKNWQLLNISSPQKQLIGVLCILIIKIVAGPFHLADM